MASAGRLTRGRQGETGRAENRPESARFSSHGWGLVIDINHDRNPMVFGPLVTDIPDAVVVVWKSLGFGWGGEYRSRKDPMHFEFLGTPAQAALLITSLGLTSVGASRRTGEAVLVTIT